ncbi:uncharacterized protein L3040_008897 [Drepanopeziza brunnea f. sp. 'multigermtubi']|uniref:Prenylated Rab acceptor 1 n=1 Tax=Marssonina brunnea f. sp. multigermtubi (strain MB_m1) TaxID=1072389 RepID=K1WXI8_MARBU|nr:uncharacterized protein MBM_04829 [Drepanopeziza brunnea f. sp. 'multigermtubi' MB_m1]EKD17252.1 hypothetical protein MBM_04829 [Drepanopeziza brunnea f. sp. 'multigermtubi' MB_m1]KAJ5032290.1 hypothetical protein L3040_008897 [Drepanopeziza brunnea f. sp. 'multigermtubi']
MPPWGRPPGAKGSRRRRQWEAEQVFWDESRVEELDSDDTDTQGVGLKNSGGKRFYSDPLHFTGGDMASASRARRSYAFGDSEDSSESEDSEVAGTDAVQIALRDKEEALVQSALARIRRAQEKGKREVKLNQDELDALENRRKRMQAAATAKAQKGSGSSGGSDKEKRRRGDRISVPLALAAAEPVGRPSSLHSNKKGKGKSTRSEDSPANPPGLLLPGADEHLAYTALGTYPSQVQPQSTSRSSRSATTQQLRDSNNTVPYLNLTQGRHFSDGMQPASSYSNSSRRPLPDDADWHPSNSRPSSVASSHSQSQGFIVDPFEYQVSSGTPPPVPHQYLQSQSQGRMNLSGPADVTYSSVRRTLPVTSSYSRAPASDPNLRSRRLYEPDIMDSSSEEEVESDDLGNGVQVFVEEEREVERDRERERGKEKHVSRKPVGGKKKGKR